MVHHDIVILGLGPAAVVTAIHLQRLGLKPVLAGTLRRHAAFEGLAPRVVEGLRRAGLDHGLAVATCQAGRTAHWNGATNSANIEYLVDRIAFDRALLQDAEDASLPIIRSRIGACHHNGKFWQISLTTADGTPTIKSPFLVEARGRRAPRHGTSVERGPRTLSMARRYTGCKTGAANTYLTSFRDGWCWFASFGNGNAIVQITISGDAAKIGNRAFLESLFDDTLATLDAVKARLGTGTSPASPLIIRDATPVASTPVVDNHHLRVGDAVFAIDPLSGHGNFEAVGGAMAAAIVINTLLNRPENSDDAKAFYHDRATLAFRRHARVGRDFYRLETQWPDAVFWQARRGWPDNEPAHAPSGITPSDLPPVNLVNAPVIEDGFIVKRRVIITPDQPRGIRMVDGVPVVDLLSAIQEKETDVGTLAKRFNATPAQINTALQWLAYRRLISLETLHESRRSAP